MTALPKSLGCVDMPSLYSTPLPDGGDELLNTSHESKASSVAPFRYHEVMMNQSKSRDQKNSPLAVPEGGGDDVVEDVVNESSMCPLNSKVLW